MFYVLGAIIILIVTAGLYTRVTTLALTKLNMSSFVFYLMTATAFVGATTVLTGLSTEQNNLEALSDDSVRLSVWYAVMWAMPMIPIGMIAANALLLKGSGVDSVLSFLQRPTESSFLWGDRNMRRALLIASAVAIGSLTFMLSQLEAIPLFSVITGEREAMALALQRASSRISAQYDSRWLLIVEMHAAFTQLLAYIAYSHWSRSRETKDAIWTAVMVIAAVISLTYNLSKTSLMVFVAGFMVVMILARGRVQHWRLSFGLVSCSVVLFYMYSFYRDVQVENVGEAFGYTVYKIFGQRLMWGNLMPVFYSFDIFPRVFPHLGLSSTGRLIHEWLGLPLNPESGFLVMLYWDPVGVSQGAAGHASSIFIGEAWANFGLAGVVVAPFVVGFVIQAVHVFFLRSRKTPIHVGLYAHLINVFPLTTGFQGFYYPAGIIQLGALVGFWIVVGLVLRATTGRRTPLLAPTNTAHPRWRPGVIHRAGNPVRNS